MYLAFMHSNLSQLPAPLPSPTALLQRAQGMLGLLREVVQEGSAEDWYERGKAAMKPGSLSEAMLSLQKCIMIEPSHWRAALQLTIILASQASEATVAMLSQAMKPYYDGEISWEIWSSYYCKCPKANREALKMGLELNLMSYGDNPEIWFFLLIAVEATYSSSTADALYQLNLRCPEFAATSYAFNMHCAASQGANNSVKALQFYSKAIALAPKAGSAYRERGLLFKLLGKYEAAYQDFATAIAMNDLLALRYRALLKESLGKYDSAINDITEFINKTPHDSSNYYLRAELKQKAGDITGAALDFKEAKKKGNN
jgi:tetratricopeptide (TPR) repeat protein